MTTPAYIHKYKIGISGNIATHYKDNYLLEEQDIINAFQDNRWIVGNRGDSCETTCNSNSGDCSKGLSQRAKVNSKGIISTINTILKRETNKNNLSCHRGYRGPEGTTSYAPNEVNGQCYWGNGNSTCNDSNTTETQLCCCPKEGEDSVKVCPTSSLDIKGIYDSVPDTNVKKIPEVIPVVEVKLIGGNELNIEVDRDEEDFIITSNNKILKKGNITSIKIPTDGIITKDKFKLLAYGNINSAYCDIFIHKRNGIILGKYTGGGEWAWSRAAWVLANREQLAYWTLSEEGIYNGWRGVPGSKALHKFPDSLNVNQNDIFELHIKAFANWRLRTVSEHGISLKFKPNWTARLLSINSSQKIVEFQKNRSIFYSLKVLGNNLFNNILFNNDGGSTTNANYLDEINKLNVGVSGMIDTNITNFKYDNEVDTEQLIKNIIRLKSLKKDTGKLNKVLNKYKSRIDKLKTDLDNEYLDFKEKDNLNDRNSFYYLKELDKKNKVLKYIRVIFYIIICILIIIILYNLFIKIKKKF